MLGSVNMDLVVRTPRLPAAGETVLGSRFRTAQGGKGANQAIAAARAGGDVTMIGAVGSDAFGQELVDAVRAENISTLRLRRIDGPSGIAVITVDDEAENTIVVAPGANGTLTNLTGNDEAEIRRADLLVLQLEVPLDVVLAGARAAAAAGVPVLLNPSPARALPAELVGLVTVLVVNEGEGAVLGENALSVVPQVVTTLGARGARVRGPDGATVEVPAPRVAAVDTTGAGDAFAGALAVAWVRAARHRGPAGTDGWVEPVVDAAMLRWACAAGALATTAPGAGASAPRRDEIDAVAGAAGSPPEKPGR